MLPGANFDLLQTIRDVQPQRYINKEDLINNVSNGYAKYHEKKKNQTKAKIDAHEK